MKTFKIYAVESGKELVALETQKDTLVDNDLIHNDGKRWLYFDENETMLKQQLVKAVVSDEEITKQILSDFKEMDADTFCCLIDYMYSVKSEYDPDHETVSIEKEVDDDVMLGDIFGTPNQQSPPFSNIFRYPFTPTLITMNEILKNLKEEANELIKSTDSLEIAKAEGMFVVINALSSDEAKESLAIKKAGDF